MIFITFLREKEACLELETPWKFCIAYIARGGKAISQFSFEKLNFFILLYLQHGRRENPQFSENQSSTIHLIYAKFREKKPPPPTSPEFDWLPVIWSAVGSQRGNLVPRVFRLFGQRTKKPEDSGYEIAKEVEESCKSVKSRSKSEPSFLMPRNLSRKIDKVSLST